MLPQLQKSCSSQFRVQYLSRSYDCAPTFLAFVLQNFAATDASTTLDCLLRQKQNSIYNFDVPSNKILAPSTIQLLITSAQDQSKTLHMLDSHSFLNSPRPYNLIFGNERRSDPQPIPDVRRGQAQSTFSHALHWHFCAKICNTH